jgi:phosphoribosylformimino-5-aminoimidazole carboxamide ribotide isomerase
MRIIPAIDIIGGKCVRLSRGDYNTQKTYRNDPLELALEIQDHGMEYLHLVDLDGAKAKTIQNHRILHDIATKTNLKIDFGGGVKSLEDLNIAFENGASQVTLASMAIQNPSLFKECFTIYGQEKIILGADCRNRQIATQGWLNQSNIDVLDFIAEFSSIGIAYVICTDISKDGMLQGTAAELYTEILKAHSIKLIASGGISSIADLEQLKALGCEGAIVGKALYEGHISLKELSNLC